MDWGICKYRFCTNKPFKNTTWYITFDIEEDNIVRFRDKNMILIYKKTFFVYQNHDPNSNIKY